MTINLLKEEKLSDKNSRSNVNVTPDYEIEMYIPPEEPQEPARKKKRQRQKAKQQERQKLKPQDAPIKQVQTDDGVDLSRRYVRRQRLMRRLKATGVVSLIVFVLIVGGYSTYVILTRDISPQLTSTELMRQESSQQTQSQVAQLPEPQQATEPQSSEPRGSLPDTELAPLAGALVTFRDTNEIFLIEKNGELRLVNQELAVFNNGQRLSEISPRLIYLLPDRWQSIRRGAQEVSGQVEFDPRVLTTPELLPFIQANN